VLLRLGALGEEIPESLVAVLLEVPLAIVQRADLAGLQPPGDAVEVEGVVANAPGHGALLAGGGRLVRLALDAQVHDVVAANGAIVHHDVWRGLDLNVILVTCRFCQFWFITHPRPTKRRRSTELWFMDIFGKEKRIFSMDIFNGNDPAFFTDHLPFSLRSASFRPCCCSMAPRTLPRPLPLPLLRLLVPEK